MKHQDEFLKHFQNDRFRDRDGESGPWADSLRLKNTCFIPGGGGWGYIDILITEGFGFFEDLKRLDIGDVTWFPDANIAFSKDTDFVWQALQSAVEKLPDGSARLVSDIEAEMADWMNEPREHVERARAIRDSLDGNGWIRRCPFPQNPDVYQAILGYAVLLGQRKKIAIPSSTELTELGVNGAKKSRMGAVQKYCGGRAVALARLAIWMRTPNHTRGGRSASAT